MKRCEDIQKELEAYLSNDVDATERREIQSHLVECHNCSEALHKLTKLSEVLQSWEEIEPSPRIHEKLEIRIQAHESTWRQIFTYSFAKKVALRFAEVAVVVVLTLLVSHLIQKSPPKVHKDLATVDFYLKEHLGAATQAISAELLSLPATRIYEGQDDFIYFEFIEDHPQASRSGILLKGPPVRREIRIPKDPALTKGCILTLAQVRITIDFNPLILEQIDSGFILENIRKIEDYNCLHLLYSNGMDTLSVFEQPWDSKGGLTARDFREYAIFREGETVAGFQVEGKQTILAWREGTLSFVLIGKKDMSQLMKIAQSFRKPQRKHIISTDDSLPLDYSSSTFRDYKSVKTTKRDSEIQPRGKMISREKKKAWDGV